MERRDVCSEARTPATSKACFAIPFPTPHPHLPVTRVPPHLTELRLCPTPSRTEGLCKPEGRTHPFAHKHETRTPQKWAAPPPRATCASSLAARRFRVPECSARKTRHGGVWRGKLPAQPLPLPLTYPALKPGPLMSLPECPPSRSITAAHGRNSFRCPCMRVLFFLFFCASFSLPFLKYWTTLGVDAR